MGLVSAIPPQGSCKRLGPADPAPPLGAVELPRLAPTATEPCRSAIGDGGDRRGERNREEYKGEGAGHDVATFGGGNLLLPVRGGMRNLAGHKVDSER